MLLASSLALAVAAVLGCILVLEDRDFHQKDMALQAGLFKAQLKNDPKNAMPLKRKGS